MKAIHNNGKGVCGINNTVVNKAKISRWVGKSNSQLIKNSEIIQVYYSQQRKDILMGRDKQNVPEERRS